MLDVDDIVADVEIFERREERRSFGLGLRFMAGSLREQLFLREESQSQFGRQESGRKIAVQDIERRASVTGRGPARGRPFDCRHVVFTQERKKPINLVV